MKKDQGIFMNQGASFWDEASAQFIYSDLYQPILFPKEYPAIILVHQEHPAEDVPMHWHPGPELIYTRNRELTVMIDGEKNIVHPGEFILISSYALHSVVPSPSPERQDVLGVTFQIRSVEQIYPNVQDLEISRDSSLASEESRMQMVSLCEQLRKHLESVNAKSDKHFETNRIVFSMLQMMYNDFLVPERESHHKDRDTLNKLIKILNYIEEHYREDLTTQSVADYFGYSREYFCRLFKHYANQTFKQYLLDLRLRAAAEELCVTNQYVGQVALKHGFPNETTFFRSFKKKYGMSPAQFSKNNRK